MVSRFGSQNFGYQIWFCTRLFMGVTLQWSHNERDCISNHQPHDCLLNRLFKRRSQKTSKLRVTGLCEGNSPVTGEFPAQRASNAENVSIWWHHHGDRWPACYCMGIGLWKYNGSEELFNAHLFDSLGYYVHRYDKQSRRSNVQFIFHIIWLSLKFRGENVLTQEHREIHRYIFVTMTTSALVLENVTFAANKTRNWNNIFQKKYPVI